MTESQTTSKRTGDPIFESFLSKQCGPGLALAAASDVLDLHPIGSAVPRRYIASFNARTMAQTESGEIVPADRFDIGVFFHDDYLRRCDPARVLTYLGPHRCFHPNVRGGMICVNLRAGMPLVDLLATVYDLFTWRLYGVGDNGLNPEAADWVRHRDPSTFPTDPRPLKGRSDL